MKTKNVKRYLILTIIPILLFFASCGSKKGTTGQTYTLTVDKFGKGTIISDNGGISCGSNCSKIYPAGTTVVLTAEPDTGYQLNSWAGCDATTTNTCTVTINGNKTVLPTFGLTQMILQPNVKVLDATTMQYLLSKTGNTYYFTPQAIFISTLKQDDVIVSNVGNGLIGRVTGLSISPNGDFAVSVTTATLEDVVQQGTISWSGKLTSDKLQSFTPLAKGVTLRPASGISSDYTIDIGHDFGPISIKGSETLSFGLDFAATYNYLFGFVPTGLNEFKSVLFTKASGSLSVEASGSVTAGSKITIATFIFAPIPILPPAIVLVPKITVYVGITGEVSATLTTGITIDSTYTAGLYYKTGQGWSPISNYSQNFGYIPPTLSAEDSVKGFVEPELTTLIDDVAGPYVDINGYLKIETGATTSTNELSWKLSAGMGADVGSELDIPILGWELSDYSTNLFDCEWVLASSTVTLADIIPPSVPAGLSVNVISSGQVNLLWNASTDNVLVSGYKVYRNGQYLKSVTTNSTSDVGLSPNTNYCYTVLAYDEANNDSEQSAQVCITTPPANDTIPPSVPTGLSANVISSGQVNLLWNASTDNVAVAGYVVVRNGIRIKSTTTTTAFDTGLNPSTQYCYAVSAYDNAGNTSAASKQVCVTTLSPNSPPTNLVATAGNGQVSLSWSASYGATSYNIYESTTSGGSYTKINSTTNTNYTVTGLTNGATYYFVVTAVNTNGESSASAQVSAAPATTVDITGTWSGSWASSNGINNGNISAVLTQSGTSVIGTLSITGSPCISNGSVSGTVSGNNVSFGIISGSDTVEYNATYTSTSMSGTYSVTTGACAGDTGTFSLSVGE